MAGREFGDHERDEIRSRFDEAVNMTAKELEDWLQTPESQEVGWGKDDGGESVGHESGRRIVAIMRKKRAELDDDDHAHMQKVAGYVQRHLAQGGPDEGVEESRWRFSLKNWGHDPLNDGG
jgi:hypothetical protein